MTEIIRETGIFIIVAEAMVCLAPSEVYKKYIRLIVGMVLVVQLALPVLSLISGSGGLPGFEEIPVYEMKTEFLTGEKQEDPVQRQMEKEIMQRLGQLEEVQILDIELKEREDGNMYLLVVLEAPEKDGLWAENSTIEGKEEWLQQKKQYIAEKLQMDMSDMEVEVSEWR